MEGDLLSFLGSLLLYSFIAFFAYFSRAISPKNGVRILKYSTRKVVFWCFHGEATPPAGAVCVQGHPKVGHMSH